MAVIAKELETVADLVQVVGFLPVSGVGTVVGFILFFCLDGCVKGSACGAPKQPLVFQFWHRAAGLLLPPAQPWGKG